MFFMSFLQPTATLMRAPFERPKNIDRIFGHTVDRPRACTCGTHSTIIALPSSVKQFHAGRARVA
eukprot:5930155-Pyramimonas_sp.AAC.1